MKTKKKPGSLRNLPSVDSILKSVRAVSLIENHGRPQVVSAVRKIIGDLRAAMMKDPDGAGARVSPDGILDNTASLLAQKTRPLLGKAVNATGVILHTGLGRAVMPDEARVALSDVTGFCNLQTDLESGKRSRRENNILDLVRELTGAEDAVLVNNNAGATMLALKTLAAGKEVVVSRGELIEIGGSFRLPDIMKESGAILKEVGTTNKTHAADYEKAIGPDTAMLLKAHKSNYSIIGFSADVDIKTIAAIGKKKKKLVVDDLGCGALVNLEQFGLPHEVTVRESLAAGADLVLFSTDKLIGGPQGGLIVGKAKLIEKIRKHPLYRILRVCKLTLAALEASLKLFLAPELLAKRHPLYRLIAKSEAEIEKQANDLAAKITGTRPDWKVSVERAVSFIGGGALPGAELPSRAVKITAPALSANELALNLRRATVPVVARIAGNAVHLDMRTVSPDEIVFVVDAITGIA